MASCSQNKSTASKTAGMAQIVVGQKGDRLESVLGSCVGVAIHHPRLNAGALAHVVLPKASNSTERVGKFADTAVPHMVQLLEKQGVPRAGLVAKIAGGACMFGADGPLKIGKGNIDAVIEQLKNLNIPIQARDVGGTTGRRVSLDCSTGILTVQTVGNEPRTL